MDDNVRGTQGMDEISGSRPRPRATGVRNGGGGGIHDRHKLFRRGSDDESFEGDCVNH